MKYYCVACLIALVKSGAQGTLHRCINISKACTSLPPNTGSAIQCFKSRDIIEIHNEIAFDFLPGLSHTLYLYSLYFSGYIVKSMVAYSLVPRLLPCRKTIFCRGGACAGEEPWDTRLSCSYTSLYVVPRSIYSLSQPFNEVQHQSAP